MRKIKILSKNLTGDEINSVTVFAKEADCIPQEIEVVTSIGQLAPDIEDEVILVLATPATCAASDLENELSKAPNGGRRVIWIWPEDSDASELPPAAAKYVYSAIPWDAKKLKAVAADGDEMCFETPTGTPLPKVETERNLCVEEKETAKAKAKAKAK